MFHRYGKVTNRGISSALLWALLLRKMRRRCVKMCPRCCKVEKRSASNLQKPDEFKGKVLFVDPPDVTGKPDFEAKVNSAIIHLAATVR